MRKICFLLMVSATILVAKFSFGNTYSCYSYSDFGYDIGYDAGAQEKREGYSFDPDTVLNQPLYQIALKSIKQEAHITPYEEPEFDRCFRKGFYDGYKAGYEGWEKRTTRYDEKGSSDQATDSIPEGKGVLCDTNGKCWQLINGEIEQVNAEKE